MQKSLSSAMFLTLKLRQTARGETQTLRAGRSNAGAKNFRPAEDPFPEEQDGQNLISWRWSLPSPTDPVW